MTEPATVLMRYEALVATDAIARDEAQIAVAKALDDVINDLEAEQGSLTGFLRRRLGRAKAVRGLYVWGGVGRGKTMLMDLFFAAVPVENKRRVHFNAFMGDVHGRIARLRTTDADDAVADAADEIAAEARVLCFDEFAVTDIADAMILSRLFTRIFDRGVTLVATSNVAPQELYSDGLNRKLSVPFIRQLTDNVDVERLDAATDYRLDRLEARRVWFAPGESGFDRLWEALLGAREAQPETVAVGSRRLAVPAAAGGLARFKFAELVERPVGAGDYLALAQRFHTIFVDGIPVLTAARRETARRLIVLIDILYDQKVRLVATASAEPDRLFEPEPGAAPEEAFAFSRTASRLFEMRSAGYLRDIEQSPLT